jgi:catechol 2,3-dioxygenase-like lactoylglutathione lyase family enzyme
VSVESPFRLLHHVCIVVRDVDAAVAFYESVGIGPWHDYPPLTQYTDLTVPDPAGFFALRYKYADLSNVQLQLCQPTSGRSPQREFLERHGEGVFHLGFSVPICDDGERTAVAIGLDVLMRGRRPDGSGFTYFDTAPRAGVTLEVRAAPPSGGPRVAANPGPSAAESGAPEARRGLA